MLFGNALRWPFAILWLLMASGNCFAQIPGHWELADSVLGWKPIDMQFADALHGIILADSMNGYPPTSNIAIRTEDGGHTWELIVPDSVGVGSGYYHPYFQRNSQHSFTMPSAADAYDLNSNGLYGHVFATHDSGRHWEDYDKPFTPGIFEAWFRMFDPTDGWAIDVTRGSGVPVAKTNDSARTFSGVGYNDPIDNRIQDAVFLDSLNFWVSYSDGEMLHTTDGGISFCGNPNLFVCGDTILPEIDTIFDFTTRYSGGILVVDTNQAFLLGTITPTNNPNNLYVLINRSGPSDTAYPFHSNFNLDYLETRDGGTSWIADSSFGSPRIHQLCTTGPNTLWAVVGSFPFYVYTSSAYGDNYLYDGFDTLAYSPDDGKTWY